MLGRDGRDTIIGGAVIVAGLIAMVLVFVIGGRSADVKGGYYLLDARFNRADGISVGSPVRLSGTLVGHVVAMTLDERYRALLTLDLRPDLRLPVDTAVVIHTDGLLGAKFLEVRPGGDEAMLRPGAEIAYTQDAVVIEDLLEMIIQQGRAKRGYFDKPLPVASN
jgi:phospholipid/cholesterol/gamma-HCH transport system substrate-binding protein